MKSSLTIFAVLTALAFSLNANAQFPQAEEYQPTNSEFDAFGGAVVELLKTHGATGFAAEYSPVPNDW